MTFGKLQDKGEQLVGPKVWSVASLTYKQKCVRKCFITLLLCGKTQLMEHDDSLVVAYLQLVTQSSIICPVNKGYIVRHSQGFVLK